MTKSEQETSIVWDAEEKIAHIFSANPVTIRKLDKPAAEYPGVYECRRIDPANECKQYTVPARCIRFGKPASEARREAGRIRAQNMRKNSSKYCTENT